MTRTTTALLVGVLLAACTGQAGPGDGDVLREQPAQQGEAGGIASVAGDDEQTEDPSPGASSEPADAATPAAGTPDTEATLLAALERYAVLLEQDPDGFGPYCTELTTWSELRDASSVVDEVEDAGRTTGNDELVTFNCGAARQAPQLFGVQVTVDVAGTGLPDGLAPAMTPDGHDVLVGEVELGDLTLFSGAPVGAAVLVAGDAVLHVTAVPDVLSPEQLLPLVDASLQDLAGAG